MRIGRLSRIAQSKALRQGRAEQGSAVLERRALLCAIRTAQSEQPNPITEDKTL
jgi:hypothetical protein